MVDEKLNERMAVAESQIAQHEDRLNRQDDRIGELQKQNVKQDAKLTKLCQKIDKNSEMTQQNQKMIADIYSQGKTTVKLIKAIIYGVPAVIAFYVAIKQLGIF